MSRHFVSVTTTQVAPKWLERNLYGHSLQGLLWDRQFEKVLIECVNGRKHQPGHALLCIVSKVYSVDDIKMAGKRHNLEPMWERLMKHADLDKPTQFLDQVYLGFTQREFKKKNLVDEYRRCSAH